MIVGICFVVYSWVDSINTLWSSSPSCPATFYFSGTLVSAIENTTVGDSQRWDATVMGVVGREGGLVGAVGQGMEGKGGATHWGQAPLYPRGKLRDF